MTTQLGSCRRALAAACRIAAVAAVLAGALAAPPAAAQAPTRTVTAGARLDYVDPAPRAAMRQVSNEVVAAVWPSTATVAFYDAGFRVVLRTAAAGQRLHVQAVAPGCNATSGIDQVAVRIVSGDTQRSVVVQATETDHGSGVFRAEVEPMAMGQDDGSGDTMWAELEGCGATVRGALEVDSGGVVFDSRGNQPLSGAKVTLIDVDGSTNGGTPGAPARVLAHDGVTPAPSTVTTGIDGRYRFPQLGPGRYRLLVEAPGYQYPSAADPAGLPARRRLHASLSFGNEFAIQADTAFPRHDVPADPMLKSLMVQASVSRHLAEVAESVVYTLVVKNAGESVLDAVTLSARLPQGFAYVPGTLRRPGGEALPEPEGGRGPALRMRLGRLAPGGTQTLQLRALIGPIALQGDGRLVAQARAEWPALVGSNAARVQVKVQPGVFTDKAMVLGTVFADCNANGMPDDGEPGVPGVRLLLQDGSTAVTDASGRYSFYGLRPRTHVLKVDGTSLPAGASLLALSARHAGDGATRFVDPQPGELHRADFAIDRCDAPMRGLLAARAARLRTDRELESALKTELTPDDQARALGDVRALQASGLVGTRPGEAAEAAVSSGAPASMRVPVPAAPPASAAEAPAADVGDGDTLQALAAQLDPSLGFLDLQDGQAVAGRSVLLRVKGRAGARITLAVNGQAIGEDRVGERVRQDERQIELREYVGVPLQAGTNTLTLTEHDGFGNERGRQTLAVRAPGALAQLRLVVPQAPQQADGEGVAAVGIELLDEHGLRVAGRLPVTLQASRGQWDVADLDALAPGVQTFVEGGHAVLGLRAPAQAGDATLAAAAGAVQATARVRYEPALRPLLAAGLLEGTIDLRRLVGKGLQPAVAEDGFEQALQAQAHGERTGARAALFLKGKVRGDALLTLAYDADKDTGERLFRDIQPDAFYPVYGDASVKGFDAQSTGKLYVKVERGASFVLYGDFTTQPAAAQPARQLSAYQRSLTGLKAQHEAGPVRATVFASRDGTRQRVVELRGNGTSGPYALGLGGARVNSERVELLVRDRHQPAVVLRSTPQQRFTNYEFDAFTGSLLLRTPVPSLDADLNPVSLRVTVEVEEGGPAFWVAGAELEADLGERLAVGASVVRDWNPLAPFQMAGVHASARLGERTTLLAEAARTRGDGGLAAQAEGTPAAGTGQAQRVELQHDGDALKLRAFAGRSERGFLNAGSSLNAGRSEAGLKASWSIDERTRVLAEALHTADLASDAQRDGVLLGIERSLGEGFKAEVGVRRVLGRPPAGGERQDTQSVRGKLSGALPGWTGASAYVEAEQDVHDARRRLLAVGGDWQMPGSARLYARHELVSSLGGPYTLDPAQRRHTTLVGLDAPAGREGRAFSEYRARDAISGREAEAAIGLRNRWPLAEGLRIDTTLERVHALQRAEEQAATAATAAIEYTADPLWKGTARLELRDAAVGGSGLGSLGVARKLAQDWTFLGRFVHAEARGNDGAPDRVQQRLQLGMALRGSGDRRINGLGRYEHKREEGLAQGGSLHAAGIAAGGRRTVHTVSVHADQQRTRDLVLSGHYAAKLVEERIDGLGVRSAAQRVGGRATWALGDRWDVGLAASVMGDARLRSRAVSAGAELGWRVQDNLWVSLGHNVRGFHDRELSGGDVTRRGAYLRVRFKFDERLLSGLEG
ncbi:SdrD B-like domain-containing protein [Aquincola sp. MAHUQ-54]|uniref:SdrD B-like domain-containing protein n=1 Tax=Aquincola agrisoli TaxID=3119538 RepID=A0AAW9Q1C8_9BURK